MYYHAIMPQNVTEMAINCTAGSDYEALYVAMCERCIKRQSSFIRHKEPRWASCLETPSFLHPPLCWMSFRRQTHSSPERGEYIHLTN